jgi:hypothetical protein
VTEQEIDTMGAAIQTIMGIDYQEINIESDHWRANRRASII